MIHHRGIATAMRLALTGAMDGRIVNIVDEAPTSIYERTRRLGFTPTVSTVYGAQREGIL
jgi:hypothetical protein